MRNYISEWISVIKHFKNDNTYKAAWGKAILECIQKKEYEEIDGELAIEEYFIVQKILKYYWNLNVFFNISQGDFLVVEKMTEELHQEFVQQTKKNRVWYNEIEAYLKQDQVRFEKEISKLMRVVNDNVAFRFLNLGRKRLELYRFDKSTKSIYFTNKQIQALHNNFHLLNDLMNYRWAMYLELYNKTDNLIRKIVLVSEDNYNTKKLNYYKKYLDTIHP